MRAELLRLLSGVGDLVGVSCIARGADSVFAQVVLDVGGRLEVVLPSRNYRRRPDYPYPSDPESEETPALETGGVGVRSAALGESVTGFGARRRARVRPAAA